MTWDAIRSLAEMIGATAVDEDVWIHNHPMLLAYSNQPGAQY